MLTNNHVNGSFVVINHCNLLLLMPNILSAVIVTLVEFIAVNTL